MLNTPSGQLILTLLTLKSTLVLRHWFTPQPCGYHLPLQLPPLLNPPIHPLIHTLKLDQGLEHSNMMTSMSLCLKSLNMIPMPPRLFSSVGTRMTIFFHLSYHFLYNETLSYNSGKDLYRRCTAIPFVGLSPMMNGTHTFLPCSASVTPSSEGCQLIP